MSYVVLARKYRPQSFEDLVGQGHVSATLANAIARNRVAHAFLFTGVRGVGKTTSARILAKSLNCEKGPTATPCQKCAPCVEITAGSDVDVQEIDGASYTGVDDVRRLQESLPYRPQRDRFKIFVVDEVHMLSNNAWNAFLKTLEEPPPHVKFIFATTEVHKIPVTILSRCQRYDFKLISAQAVAARLKFVLEQENVAFEDAALSVIAREAAGSMRDGMSLLDQVLAWVGIDGDKLTAEGVARVLGVADRSVLHGLAAALVDGDAHACLRTIHDLAQQGYDLPHVARDFLAHLRDLVVAKVSKDPAGLLDLADSEAADVLALAKRADADDLTRLHQGFSRSFDDIVRSGQPRAAFEMALVRLARRPPLMPVDELLQRITTLERNLLQGGGGGGTPAASGGGMPHRNSGGGAAPPPVRRASADPAPVAAFAPPPVPVASAQPPAPPASFAAPSFATSPAPQSVPQRPKTNFPPPATNSLSSNVSVNAPAPSAASSKTSGNKDLGVFRAVLDIVRDKRPALASVLEHAVLLHIGPDRLTLGFEGDTFLSKQAQEPLAQEILRNALAAHFGGRPDVTFESVAPMSGLATIAQLDSAERKSRLESARRAIANHPLVTAAIELLGAELRDVRLAQDDSGDITISR
jgi:DNA polymerase-3 subunit gamma/tau